MMKQHIFFINFKKILKIEIVNKILQVIYKMCGAICSRHENKKFFLKFEFMMFSDRKTDLCHFGEHKGNILQNNIMCFRQ